MKRMLIGVLKIRPVPNQPYMSFRQKEVAIKNITVALALVWVLLFTLVPAANAEMATAVEPGKKEETMATSKKQNRVSGLYPTLHMFKHAFEQLKRNEKLLSNQLSTAKSDYPLVVLALNLATAYGRFTERFYLDRFRKRSVDIPLPDGYGAGILTWPPEIKSKDIFQQLEEWSNAMIEAGAEAERDMRIEVRACPIIRQDYNAAQNCVQQYIENQPQSDEEWDEYLTCLERLSLHASEMRSHNCTL